MYGNRINRFFYICAFGSYRILDTEFVDRIELCRKHNIAKRPSLDFLNFSDRHKENRVFFHGEDDIPVSIDGECATRTTVQRVSTGGEKIAWSYENQHSYHSSHTRSCTLLSFGRFFSSQHNIYPTGVYWGDTSQPQSAHHHPDNLAPQSRRSTTSSGR